MHLVLLLGWLAACQKEPQEPVVPTTHSWKEEAELVSAGLRDVMVLVNQGSRPAARVLAERVYTERWQPRLEPALRELESPEATATVEYQFGLLLLDLQGRATVNKLQGRITALDQRVHEIADAAARRYPTPADRAAPPPPEPTSGSQPIVPDVKPKWETTPAG